MHVTRFSQAPAYHPPRHDNMACVRLQGHEAGPSESMWLGVSHVLPGGQTDLAASPVEKMYVVLEGSVSIGNGTEEVELHLHDSVRLAPGESRLVINRGTRTAMVLLVMAYPKP